MAHTADVVIVGAGILGCSIAYHVLRRDPRMRVVVLEREAMPGTGATATATGGIRHQFSTEPNIRLTQLSLPVYRRFEEETGHAVHFRAHGYLFVTADPVTLEAFRRQVELQQSLAVPSRLVGPDDIHALLPCIRTDDLVGAPVRDTDVSPEPAAAVQGFASAARSLGATMVCGAEVTAISTARGRVDGVRTRTSAVSARVVVVAAGPHSADVARLAGIDVPARPFRRQVSVSEPLPELDAECPLTTDFDSGFYLHRTGRSDLLLGGTDRDARPGYALDVDGTILDGLLAAAVHRVPALARARIRRTYVGLRGLTPDFNLILGRVAAVQDLVLACGDNGHGFMHAPAIGRLLAEEIVDGRASTLDLAPFRLERFGGGDGHHAGEVSGERTMF